MMGRRLIAAAVVGMMWVSGCTERMRTPASEQVPMDRATQLAQQVIVASGGKNWPKVERVQFTFNVEQDGKVVASRRHDWNVKTGMDTVTAGEKTTTVSTTAAPGEGDADAKQAYQQWVNDSYWLIAPLKLRDPGVTLTHLGRKEVEGKAYEVLQTSYQNVGLTPGDRYNFYIDPETHLVRRWDYMPNPERTVSGTWEEYQDFNGVKISTSRPFGPRRIFFTDVVVTK